MATAQGSAGFIETVLSEMEFDGGCFRVVDYRWKANVDTSARASRTILRWREQRECRLHGWSDTCPRQDVGQLTLQPAGIAIDGHTFGDVDGVRALTFSFDEDWFLDVTAGPSSNRRITLRPSLDLRNAEIDRAMRRLMGELTLPAIGMTKLAEGLALAIAVDVARSCQVDDGGYVGGMSERRLEQIHQLIEAPADAPPSLAEVAHSCGLTPAHLSRSYKAATGRSLHEAIEGVRLLRAQALLAHTELPLKVISHRLGFQYPSAFSAFFKRMTMETPRHYRDRRLGQTGDLRHV